MMNEPLILESARSFPRPTSMKSNDAFPCVKPSVNSRRSSVFSREPSRFMALARPLTLAHTFAITSISSDKSLHCSRTAFRRVLAAFFPPSMPCRISSSLNCAEKVSSQRHQKLRGKTSVASMYSRSCHLHQSEP
jgi:hypothetical protein